MSATTGRERPKMSIENDRPLKDVQYILFKNAANVNGVVTRNDVICEWPVRDREKQGTLLSSLGIFL